MCSFLAWTLSKLSESYESRASFELEFTDFPDTLLLNTSEKQFINAKLRTSGFQFLSYGISPKKLRINLSNVTNSNGKYFITANNIKPQFEKQLSNNVSIIELENDKLFVDLFQVVKKEIPVEADISLVLSQNHLLEGELQITPKSVVLKGPSNEIAGIKKIKTESLILNDLSADFSNKMSLVKPEILVNGQLSHNSVVVSGKVVRFSEKEYTIPIKAINLPDGFGIRMFPDKVSLVCKAGVDTLKNIDEGDFEVLVDCANIDQSSNKLALRLTKSPKNVYALRLLNDEIEFVLEKL